MQLRYTKLDMFDYEVRTLELNHVDIQIQIESQSDVLIADIASELTSSDGHIYLENNYYAMRQMAVSPGTLHIFAEQTN